MEYQLDDTICALATHPGEAAIGVIRMSGSKSISICNAVFEGKDLNKVDTHTLHFGKIVHPDTGKVYDEVLVSVFKGDKSFTGEPSIEISCHGSPYILKSVLELLIEQGCRAASPGEFTLRAYLNKKMDLSQAEAVADIISAKGEKSHQLALQQMRGGYSNAIGKLREELINFASLIELELDFSEEDVEFADRKALATTIEQLIVELTKLKSSFALGNAIKKGIPVAIIGEPNVGKSTLLNALLEEEKAIVTEIAGTTRDVIEDEINILGVLFRFIDTAGLRETQDVIEKMGIERTHKKLKEASIIIHLVDGTKDIENEESKIDVLEHQKLIRVVNKLDAIFSKTQGTVDETLHISAKEGINLDLLKQKLLDISKVSSITEDDILVSNTRHFEAMNNTLESLKKVLQAIEKGLPGDLMAVDIRRALHYLGEITGEITPDDLLGNIFSKFCIGK